MFLKKKTRNDTKNTIAQSHLETSPISMTEAKIIKDYNLLTIFEKMRHHRLLTAF